MRLSTTQTSNHNPSINRVTALLQVTVRNSFRELTTTVDQLRTELHNRGYSPEAVQEQKANGAKHKNNKKSTVYEKLEDFFSLAKEKVDARQQQFGSAATNSRSAPPPSSSALVPALVATTGDMMSEMGSSVSTHDPPTPHAAMREDEAARLRALCPEANLNGELSVSDNLLSLAHRMQTKEAVALAVEKTETAAQRELREAQQKLHAAELEKAEMRTEARWMSLAAQNQQGATQQALASAQHVASLQGQVMQLQFQVQQGQTQPPQTANAQANAQPANMLALPPPPLSLAP